MAYPAGPRGTRLHGPGWQTRAGRPSLAGPGRPGTRRSLPGWLGAVRPGRPGEGEAAPARPGARPRGGAEDGGGDRELGRHEGALGRKEERTGCPCPDTRSRKTWSWRRAARPGDGALTRCSTGLPPLGTLAGSSIPTNGRPCFSSLDLSPFFHPFHPRSSADSFSFESADDPFPCSLCTRPLCPLYMSLPLLGMQDRAQVPRCQALLSW